MSTLAQRIKGIKMIWMLGCLIISTFINHGAGFRCSLGWGTRIYNGNKADPRKHFIDIHIFVLIENLLLYFKDSWPWIVSIQVRDYPFFDADFP